MFVRSLVLAASVAVLALSAQSASAAEQVKIGDLRCEVAGGPGLIVASQRGLNCHFVAQDGHVEHYVGSITKVGVDIGPTGDGQLGWTVFAPTGAPLGALAGDYGGVTGSVSVGVGLGANVLIGGNASTIALQPISLNAQTGLNVAAGIAGLSLHYVEPPLKKKHHRHHRHH